MYPTNRIYSKTKLSKNDKNTSARTYRIITLPYCQKTFKTATYYARKYYCLLKDVTLSWCIQKTWNGQQILPFFRWVRFMFRQRHLHRKDRQGYIARPYFTLKKAMCACKTLNRSLKTVLCDSMSQMGPFWRLGVIATSWIKTKFRVVDGNLDAC